MTIEGLFQSTCPVHISVHRFIWSNLVHFYLFDQFRTNWTYSLFTNHHSLSIKTCFITRTAQNKRFFTIALLKAYNWHYIPQVKKRILCIRFKTSTLDIGFQIAYQIEIQNIESKQFQEKYKLISIYIFEKW